MSEAGKALDFLKDNGVNVNVGTLVATIVILFILLIVFFSKYYPKITEWNDKRTQKKLDQAKEHQQLIDVVKKQQEHDKQFGEIMTMINGLSGSLGEISTKLDRDYDGHRVTLSVLLDIVECMQASTSPEECARQAQSKINGYIGHGKLPLQ